MAVTDDGDTIIRQQTPEGKDFFLCISGGCNKAETDARGFDFYTEHTSCEVTICPTGTRVILTQQ